MSSLNDVWGDPRTYKGVNIYPVKMKDCIRFYETVTCLLYEKDKSHDIEIIKMPYLRFLYVVAKTAKDENGRSFEFILDQLIELLEMVTGKTVQIQADDKVEVVIGDSVFSENDFDRIKKIICKQNLIRIDDTIFDPEVEKAIQEAREFMAKKSGNSATLEEQIVAYHCLTGMPYNKIKENTIFQFNKALERYQVIKNYEVYSSLLAENGKSKEIQHWLAHIEEKGLYDDVIMSKEELDGITSDSGVFSK